MTHWWYNLRTQQVEPDEGGPNAERLGPFETEAEAANALQKAAERNEEWSEGDDEWSGSSGKSLEEDETEES